MIEANEFSMLLTLRVQSGGTPIGGRESGRIEHTFNAAGGTLGRSVECDLVLDDPSKYISRIQGRIVFRDGGYLLAVVGTNSCMLNKRILPHGEEARLVHQDTLVIGDYVLGVHLSVARPAVQKPAIDVPAATPSLFSAAARPDLLEDDTAVFDAGAGNADPLGLNLFGGTIAAPRRQAAGAVAYRGAESDHVAPERQPMANLAIPEDYDPMAGMRPAAAASPAAAAAPPAADGDNAVLQALLSGMGLPGLQTTRSPVELAQLVGALLREATGGTMAALLARSLTKRESHIDRTMMAAQSNNPLKFFPDAGTALAQMLGESGHGYMAPARAYSNAFDDLKAHELAVITAMRMAVTEVLAQVNPRTLEQALQNDSAMDKVFATNRKARLWDRLVKVYEELSADSDDDFQRSFNERFSAAYEQQVSRIRRARK